MTRKLSPERQQELDALYRIALVFCEFRRSRLPPQFSGMLSEIVEKVYASQSITGMRSVQDELMNMLIGTPADDLRGLDTMLREGAGISLDSLNAKRLARIAKVRQKGTITTEAQYYLLRERIEEVWEDDERQDEFHALQAMMQDYEDRIVARAEKSKRKPRPAI